MILPLPSWRKSFSETLKHINPARHLHVDISKSPWVDDDLDQQEQAVADQQHEVPANQQDQAAADQQDRVVGERRSSSSSTDVTAEKERLLANRDQQDQAATDQQDQATTDQQDEAAADQQDDTPALDRFLSSTSFTTEKESLLAKQNQDPSKPDDDEFADLLIDLTLVTAYANLMNNTPIIDAMSGVSFLVFFYLVWWIWASQTIYNVRFRTRDFMHRTFAILQFVIFGTMATFTSNFSIFSGILPDDSQTPVNPVQFQLSNVTFNDVFATGLRQEHLPVLNARGISLVMAFSRLLLLSQYLLVYIHADRTIKHKKYKKSIAAQMLVLAISAISYFIAIAIIGHNPSKARNIAKLVFWFLPMILEISSYFFITRKFDDVPCPTQAIRKRNAMLFIVVVGTGLNQITGSFKYVVGAVGFTVHGVMVMISSAAIIILHVALYFRNNLHTWTGANRTYLWFFSHYLYLAALMLTLHCIEYLLAFANLYTALMTLLGMVFDITKTAYHHGVTSITADQYPNARDASIALGLPPDDFIKVINAALAQPWDPAARSNLFQTLIYIACVTFNEFDSFPERGSVLYDKIQNFLSQQLVVESTAYDLFGELIASRLKAAFWFWGVAGGTLVMLAILNWIQRKPSNKYEIGSIASRFFFGAIFVILSALTTGHNRPYFANGSTATINPKTATPWKIASSAWVIPGFAITLVVVSLIDIILRRLGTEHNDDGYNV